MFRKILFFKGKLLFHIILMPYLFAAITVNAQELTFRDLINLRSSNLDEANEFLFDKGWDFNKAGNEKNESEMSFVLYVSQDNSTNYMDYLQYDYTKRRDDNLLNSINYTTDNKHLFNNIIKDAKLNKMQLYKTEPGKYESYMLTTVYANDSHVLIASQANHNDKLFYNVKVFDREKYFSMKDV